jgi:hypothetical protein
MKIKLDELEDRIRTLVEDQLPSLVPGIKSQDAVVQQLAEAMRLGLKTQPDGRQLAPNVYTLLVHPESEEKWRGNIQTVEKLTQVVNQAADEAGLRFPSPPSVSIGSDPTLQQDELRVVASHIVEPIAETQGMAVSDNEAEALPHNAFLIVDGVKVFPLEKTVINIGRRMDNHLIIDDPRVSRNHVQLRAIRGRFVVFDLNSTGGTYVNGQRTNQSVLYPGDVVSLAGVPLIFGQDNPPPRSDLIDTAPLSHPPGDRPTAILNNDDPGK